MKFNRWQVLEVEQSLREGPAVFINGPRQAGKSTLAWQFTGPPFHAVYVTLDDMTLCAAARNDPHAFLARFEGLTIIDEVQLAPELYRAIKVVIDERRQAAPEQANGQFILTGSANVMTLPELADALVGRIRIHTLLPLGMGEYQTHDRALTLVERYKNPPLVHWLTNDRFKYQAQYTPFNLTDWLHRATFPEVAQMESEAQRSAWYRNYLSTLIQRDVRQLADIQKLNDMPRLLGILAAHAAGLMNDANIARDAGFNPVTLQRYRTLLENVFLVRPIPPWFRHLKTRLVKAPKMFFTDTGVLAHLLGNALEPDSPHFGRLVENFVATELMKQLTLLPLFRLYHYRTSNGQEVDFVIEAPDGRITGIEVKAGTGVSPHDFKGMRSLKESAGADFIQGIILYGGDQVVNFADDMVAVPIIALL